MLLERALGHADKESDCSVSIDLEREAQTLFECEFLPAFQRPSRPKTLSIPSVRSQGLRLAQSAAVVVANRYRTHHCCQRKSTRVDRATVDRCTGVFVVVVGKRGAKNPAGMDR